MRDIDLAKNLLKKNNYTLIIVKDNKVIFEMYSPGIRGLLTAVEKIGNNMKGSAVADKIVGEAAAQLCAYSKVGSVFAEILSKCGRDILEKNKISLQFEDLVPHILNLKRTDLCPFEKIVAGSKNPAEGYERLKHAALKFPS
jgi:hypothetical protein